MKKKRIITMMLTVSIAIPLIAGCGVTSKLSKIDEINKTVEDAVILVKALSSSSEDSYQPSKEAVAEYEKIVDEVVALQAQVESYVANSYTSKEFWEKFNDKLEELYQKDLQSNPNAIPTRMADTPDGLVYMDQMTIPFAKELCDESEGDSGVIKSMANMFYYSFEDYFIELIEEEPGCAKYEFYAKLRETE
jgi:hypothetical protein